MSSKEEKIELREELDEEIVMSDTARCEPPEKREGHCYCGKDRNLNIAELLCASCSRWYHESCIGYQLGKLVPFMMNYVFLCKNCSSTGLENFKKSQAAFPQMCITAIANLMQASIKEGAPKSMFSKDREIIPFIDNHWEGMTTMPRRVTQSWHSTIQRALQKDLGTLFICEEATVELTVTTSGHPLFGLNSLELTQIKPNYEAMIRGGSLKITDVGITHVGSAGSKGRSAKRKVEVAGLGPGKKRSESTLTKLPTHGYPLEHPFNKDGYRYILAEPDPHAPFRQEFDESNDWAGKPIPGWLYRTLSPSTVLLALHDRAPQLKISEDRLAVTGEKGYCMVRATHAVSRGNWYWEATVEEMPEGAATRIGFAQEYANLQAPCGYDKFGYSWRSRKGTAFNESRGRHFGGPYCEGDVIGFQIILPHSDSVNYIPPTYKDRPLVKFKSHLYYEEKDKVQESLKNLRTLPGSKIVCYKNGVCLGEAFVDMNAGAYFPAISIHKSATVSVNFGPSFKNELPQGARGMYEKAEEAIIEQTAADLLFLTENDGKLRLDLWNEQHQSSSTGPLGRWLRDLRPGKSSTSSPPQQQGPARSNPAYHSEGKGARRRNKDRRRLSFNEVDKGSSPDGSKTAPQMSSPPSIFTYLQQAAPQQPPKLLDLPPPPSRSESSASLPSSSSGLSSWGSTQDAARTGWEQAPTPPVRDSSSLKSVRYGPGHEKFPSWPVPAAADTPPAVRQCCHNTGGSHRSKSWTEQTDYPKENCPHYYTRPYMRRQASVSATPGFTLKTVLERSEAAMMFAEPQEVRRGQLPTLDREGKPIGDLRYLAPSPPERDMPGQKAEPQVPHLTQAEVEEYARTYDAALLRQQSSEFLTAPMHQSQGSYAQSEGYHSYVSSTDSTNTPFLDRLRQESSAAWTEDEDAVDVQGSTDTLSKWRGSLSDMSVTSSSLGTSTSGMSMRQLIAHSSRVQTPQRHMSESVLYLAPQQPTGSHWSSRVQRNNALNSSHSMMHQACAANRSPPPQGCLSVAERVNELERQSLSVSTSSLSCRSRGVADPAALRAFQKKALLSYYERQQQHWRSEPHLSPPPAPPRTSASSEGWRRHEPQMAVPMTRDMSDKHIPADPEVLSIRKPAIPAPEVKHVREPSLVMPEPSLSETRHIREPSMPETRHVRESSLTGSEPKHVREHSLPEHRHIRESSLTGCEPKQSRDSSLSEHRHGRDSSQPEHRHVRESSLTGCEPKPSRDSSLPEHRHGRDSSQPEHRHVRESSLTGEPKHPSPSEVKYVRELSVPEAARRHSHSSNSSLSSSEMPTSPSRKHLNGSPKMSETSSDLLGPLIVGPSISLDDWVPERPPKKPHLRSASFQQQQQRLRLVPCPLPRRSSTPEPPPPTPPPVLEDEVFHCDLPLPPPPPELVAEDWTSEGSGHAKSTTNLAGPTTYLRRSNTMESMEGSYKRTPDPCAALVTTLPVFTPTIATKTTVVNSVAVGVATQATRLLSKTSKLIEKSYPRDLKAKSPPPVNAVKPYVDLNCVATKLAAFEIKEASVASKHQDLPSKLSRNEDNLQDLPSKLSRNDDAVSTKLSRNEDTVSTKVSRNEDAVSTKVSRNEDVVSTKILDRMSRNEDFSKLSINEDTVSDNKVVSISEDVCPNILEVSSVPQSGDVSSKVVSSFVKTEERKPTRTSVASQASESTPILRLESPSSSDSDDCALSSSPKPPAATSDAASQTELEEQQENQVVSPAPLSPVSACLHHREAEVPVEIQPSPSPTLSQSRVALREEEECQQLSRDLVSQLSPSDRLLTILAPVTEPKKVTDYVSGLFRLDIRTQRPSSRLAAVSPQPPESPPPASPTATLDTSTGTTVAPLPADSAYFTTSESKARFLTQYCEDISAPSISASEDLQRKKEELVSRLGRKLAVLREEQLVLNEETELNESLGVSLQERLRGAERATEAAKLAHHVEEVGKVTSLLLSLSGRLARAENAIMGLALCDEKRTLEGKRDKLAEQLTEATQLKSSIDRRSSSVSALLCKVLDAEASADFEHFVHMKASLQVESRELADRVRLGEEQLAALRETLHS